MSLTQITTQHTQKNPGWCVSDQTPEAWVETVLKPLLAEHNAKIEFNNKSGNIHHRLSKELEDKKIKFIGQINLSNGVIENSDDHNRNYHSYKHLSFGLYWVNDANYVAISTKGVSFNSYYYTLSKIEDLRYIKEPNHLNDFLVDLNAHIKKLNLDQSKRSKIRSLKKQAVMAQIGHMAKEEQFSYYVSSTKLLIKIDILVSESSYMDISIPYSQFENILPQLREVVIKLRALHQQKIRFKLMQSSGHRIPWITPDQQQTKDT